MARIQIFKEQKADNFRKPNALPADEHEAKRWQDSNSGWWEENPNRYDFDDQGTVPFSEYSHEWYREIDRRFLVRDARPSVGWKKRPFDNYIPYDDLGEMDVLEIGVGCGSHSEILASRAKTYHGIDITEYAVEATTRRFELFDIPGSVTRMDAECMEYADQQYDFIWSWGVIHHTSNTENALDEIARVMRPGGQFVSMVYHRSVWNTYVRGGLYYGLIKGQLFQNKSLHQIIQESTDGALARYYRRKEWTEMLKKHFDVDDLDILGSKSQFVPIGMGRLKRYVMSLIPDSLGRYLTNRPLMGFMMVARCTRRNDTESLYPGGNIHRAHST